MSIPLTNLPFLSSILGACLFFGGIIDSSGQDQDAEKKEEDAPPPIRALLVTGGANHDHDLQADIITAGIRQRLKRVVEWKVHHQGAGRSDLRIPLFENAAWAEGYDLVVHNHCFPRVHDAEYIERILAPHRDGLPAVILHGALRSFSTKRSGWGELCGASGKGVLVGPVVWKKEATSDPILSGIADWTTKGAEELYRLRVTDPDTTTLFSGHIVDDPGKSFPVVWRHRYGKKQAKVFAISVGNAPQTMLRSEYLDTLARGFLWAADSLNEESFTKVEPDIPVPGILLPDTPKVLRYPGVNRLTESTATALSSHIADGRMPRFAIDGDPVTYWKSDAPGPTSFQVRWETPVHIAGLVVEWKTREPDALQIEGLNRNGHWQSLFFRSGENDRQTTVIEIEQDIEMSGLRFSIPATKPGETIAIREIAAYEELHRMPASYRIAGKRASGLHSISASEAGRKIRIRAGWNWEGAGRLPDGVEPVQLIETAAGLCFVLTRNPETQGITAWIGSRSDDEAEFDFHVFFPGLSSDATVAWDGEWLYIVQNGRVVAYRDTNGDGVADEKFGGGSLCFPEERAGGKKVPFTISRLTLSMDGWCYGIVRADQPFHTFNSDGAPVTIPQDGLVRFRRNGQSLQTVWASDQSISDYCVSDLLDIYVALEKKEATAWYRLNALPGRFGVRENPLRFTRISGGQEKEIPHLLLARGREIAGFSSANENTPALVIAELDVPFRTSSQIGGTLLLAQEKGHWNVIRLAPPKDVRVAVDLDKIDSPALPDLLETPNRLLRHEVLFELQRRRQNFTKPLRKRLQNTTSAGYHATLSWFAQRPGRSAFRKLVEAAQRDESVFAFRLLGDRPEVRNHKILGKITETTSPELSAAILSAIQRSGTNVQGLTDLSLSLAGSGREEVVTAAKNFLIEREASKVCFAVLDDPEKEALRPVAFDVLANLPKATVAEEIVLRLEKTSDPVIRRYGLQALCDLHYDAGSTWQCTSLISAMLDASLSDLRVDAVALLDAMKSRKIPIGDVSVLVNRAGKEMSLEAAVVEILLAQPQSAKGSGSWLQEIAKSKSRDLSLRSKAAALLLPLHHLSFREAFSLADDLLGHPLSAKDSQRLLEGFGKVKVPQKEISNLLQRAKGSDEERAVLGWISLARLLEQKETKAADSDRIRAAFRAVQGGTALRTMLRAATVTEIPDLESHLAKASSSDDENTRATAAIVASQIRQNTTEKTTPKNRDLDKLAQAMPSEKADPELGWRVFQREGCASCHNVHGEGLVTGPDIVTRIASRSVREFVSDVLEPAVNVSSGYGSHGFELKNGNRFFSIVEDRDETALSLRDTGGNRVNLPRDQIQWEWKSKKPLMHTHYLESISAAELAALRAYLQKLAGATKAEPSSPGE